MFREIQQCRICGNKNLVSILNLGNHALTGVFPSSKEERISSGPLELVKCVEAEGTENCGLVQLKHSFDLFEMYGLNYGYRSSLNVSMINHLKNKVDKILKVVQLEKNDIVLDIGSNDCTLLKMYPDKELDIIGIDPTSIKFKAFYPSHVKLVPDFFSADLFRNVYNDRKAKVVTSFAMFYDLEEPIKFMKDIYAILDDEGIWVVEQNYLPFMLKAVSYDTIVHEHLEYYSLKQIKWMTDKTDFKIIDVEFNDVNGGSLSITVGKRESKFEECTALLKSILENEKSLGLSTLEIFDAFRDHIEKHKRLLIDFVKKERKDGKKIFGYGASTKGNLLLQYCELTADDIPCIAEVNPDKFGKFTPETLIPIISEEEARARKPDYFLVLPWHFKSTIIAREQAYLEEGGSLLFPLPEMCIINKNGNKLLKS